MGERVELQIDAESGVATLTMNDPAERNALGEHFVHELTEKLHALEDERARVCVLRGTEEIFCSGGHKDMLVALAAGKVAATDIMISRAVLEVPIPVVAAMEGHAVGGGLTLGLCCDMVLLAEESSYGASFMNMGFTPGMGTTRLLSFAMGDYIAAEMMYSGRFFRGKALQGKAQVNAIVPKAGLLSRAMKIAHAIAEKPRGSLVLLKRSLSLPKRQAFEEARTVESFMHELSFAQKETRELIDEYYPKL